MRFLGMMLLLVGVASCSDTDMASIEAIGRPGHIVCYSASQIILDTVSTGRIQTVKHSDGWEFKDSKDGKFVRVSGPCVIRN